ncbi:MAG: hypothetical protein Q9160_005401 [Pyrenula sp. 1 TL-2023]
MGDQSSFVEKQANRSSRLHCRVKGIEDLIRQGFLYSYVDVLGTHVAEGHYDLVGPNGEIILPQVWETIIKPDWTVTMHMWPMPEAEKDSPPLDDDEVPVLQDILRPVKPKKDKSTGSLKNKNRWSRAVQAWRDLSHGAEGDLRNWKEEE